MMSPSKQRQALLVASTVFTAACANTQPASSPPASRTTPTVRGGQPTATAQIIRTDSTVTPGLRAEAICEEPGRGIIRVTWQTRGTELRLTEHRLDLTVYPDGFTKGLYVSATPVERQTFQPALGIRELLNAPAGFDVVVERVSQPTAGIVSVDLGNAEAGLLYMIRAASNVDARWIGSPVVRVMAPVCPSDEVRR